MGYYGYCYFFPFLGLFHTWSSMWKYILGFQCWSGSTPYTTVTFHLSPRGPGTAIFFTADVFYIIFPSIRHHPWGLALLGVKNRVFEKPVYQIALKSVSKTAVGPSLVFLWLWDAYAEPPHPPADIRRGQTQALVQDCCVALLLRSPAELCPMPAHPIGTTPCPVRSLDRLHCVSRER